MAVDPFFLVLLFSALFSSARGQDPCDNYMAIPHLEKRDGLYEVQAGDSLVNDRFLSEGWYGTGDTRTFLDKPPGYQRCGTLYPIWRQKSSGSVSTMCVQSNENTCSLSFDVTTKLCGPEEIFNLERSPVRNAAYCFGWPDGEQPPTFDETPILETILVDKDATKSELEFHCKFSKHQEDVFYRTNWLINDRTSISTDPVKWQSGDVVKKQALTEELLRKSAGITTFGFRVRCSVRVSYSTDKPASQPVWSTTSFIGIKVAYTTIVLKEGETKDISLQLTAPFGCGRERIEQCILNVEVYNIENPGDCEQAVLTSSLCGATIKRSEWNKPATIKVLGKITQDYGASSHVIKLKLKTEILLPPRLWSSYSVGFITVQLTKDTSKIEEKSCYAVNDPHMKTFDGRYYEQQSEGKFTMYKHNTLPIEVQLQTVDRGSYAGNCGLAVRVGRTVFEFNRCPGYDEYWSAEYTLCEDGGDVLQVKRKGNTYEVYLPTGGKVRVYLGGSHLNVYIYPSVQDVENSAGLCGKLSGVCSDDFVMRDNSYSTDETAQEDCDANRRATLTQFTDSWMVEESEDLFDHDTHENLPRWLKTNTFCSCPTDSVTNNELVQNVECTAVEAADICTELGGFTKVTPRKCSIRERRRRRWVESVSNEDKRVKRQARSWSNGWTEDTARAHCERLFQNSKSVHACRNVTGLETAGSIDNCIMDIWLTGITEFGSFSLDTVRSKCLREVVVNPVFKQNTSVTNQSVYDVVVAQACSNDCSGQGTCDEGVCVCETHYGGDDCSVDLRQPPVLMEVENDGYCDSSRDTCDVVFIYGETFVETGTTCLVEEIKAGKGSLTSTGTQTVPASILSLSHIQCNVSTNLANTGSDDTEFVRAYRISVANNGANYSQSVGAMVYDGTCITGNINGIDFTWTIQGPYCLYNGTCIKDKGSQPGNPCQLCDVSDPNSNIRTWTTSSDPSCNQETKPFPVIPVVAGIAGVVVLVIVVTCVVVLCTRKRK